MKISYRLMRYQHPCLYSKLLSIARQLNKSFFTKFLARNIFKVLIVCNICGKDCGMDSVVSSIGFTCWKCHDKYCITCKK